MKTSGLGKIYDHHCASCKINIESREEAPGICPKCNQPLVNAGFSILCAPGRAPIGKGALSMLLYKLKDYLP